MKSTKRAVLGSLPETWNLEPGTWNLKPETPIFNILLKTIIPFLSRYKKN